MKTICFYHRADLDGHCSGAIVKRAIPDAEMHGIDYGDEFPWDEIQGAKVVMVDFSLQPWSDMQRLARECAELVWIDHHKSAIDHYHRVGLFPGYATGEGAEATVILEEGKAACELAWEFFFPDEKTPRGVYLLGRYDVWDLDAAPNILSFQMGMRMEGTNPADSSFPWTELLHDGDYAAGMIHRLNERGHVILAYQKQQNERLMHSAFDYKWRGLRLLCVNAGGINSQAFESRFDPLEHDAVMSFCYVGDKQCWTFSLYSPDQRCEELDDLVNIAKSYGGGGHRCACGFQTDTLADVFGADNPAYS